MFDVPRVFTTIQPRQRPREARLLRQDQIDDVNAGVRIEVNPQGAQYLMRFLIRQVMKNAVDETEIESAELGAGLSDVPHLKLMGIVTSGILYVFGTDINTDVLGRREDACVRAWPTAEIDYPRYPNQVNALLEGSQLLFDKRRLPGPVDGGMPQDVFDGRYG